MKRLLFALIGVYCWIVFGLLNRIRSEGRENLAKLPPKGVLFVSNHLTYYMDVLAIHAAMSGEKSTPINGFWAKLNLQFVAAYETLNDRGLIPRIFNYTGAVLVRRTWRDGDQDVHRPVNPEDIDRVGAALRRGWLLTFPSGTTTAGAPVRKGTAHIIRQHMPVVVPIFLEGLDRAFHKKGFKPIERGIEVVVRFGTPLAIKADDTVDRICEILTAATSPKTVG